VGPGRSGPTTPGTTLGAPPAQASIGAFGLGTRSLPNGSGATAVTGDAPAGSASSGAAGTERPEAVNSVDATRTRFVVGKKPGRGTTFTVDLAAPARLEFWFRGPGPTCADAGTFDARGSAGMNRIRFTGTIDGEPLAPGKYFVEVRAIRGAERTLLDRIVVTVVRAGSTRPSSSFEPPTCEAPRVPDATGMTVAEGPTAGAAGATKTVAGPGNGAADLLRNIRDSLSGPLGNSAGAHWFGWLFLAVLVAALALGASGLVRFVRTNRAA
jgi:hypothetical protein